MLPDAERHRTATFLEEGQHRHATSLRRQDLTLLNDHGYLACRATHLGINGVLLKPETWTLATLPTAVCSSPF